MAPLSALDAIGEFWNVSAGEIPPKAKRPPVHGDPARFERNHSSKRAPIKEPTSFDTLEADAILIALEIFPPANP